MSRNVTIVACGLIVAILIVVTLLVINSKQGVGQVIVINTTTSTGTQDHPSPNPKTEEAYRMLERRGSITGAITNRHLSELQQVENGENAAAESKSDEAYGMIKERGSFEEAVHRRKMDRYKQ